MVFTMSSQRKKHYLPLEPILKKMKDVTGGSISKESAVYVRKILEDYIEKLTLDALEIQRLSRKKILQKDMIEVGYKNSKRRI